MDILNWIQQWFSSHCDGQWEHDEGISIRSLDNPGWTIEINLKDTNLENVELKYSLIEKSENDWYGIKIEDSIFSASGDPTKLKFLLEKI